MSDCLILYFRIAKKVFDFLFLEASIVTLGIVSTTDIESFGFGG